MTTNKMQPFSFIYLFLISSTYFGLCFRPSSGALNCIYSFWYFPQILLPAGVMDEMEILLVVIYNYTNDARICECQQTKIFSMTESFIFMVSCIVTLY